MEPPQNPAGPFVPEDGYGPRRRADFLSIIREAPRVLRAAVSDLTQSQFDTRYRNWTIRQIVHHLADSHANSYVRFKWTLTEDRPTIKPYNETLWAALPDSNSGEIGAPLALFDGLHARWAQLLDSMREEQFAREFFVGSPGTELEFAL